MLAKIQTWLGLLLFGQAVGYWPLEPLFDRQWFYVSLSGGLAGLLLIVFRPPTGPGGESDVGVECYGQGGSEYLGSQMYNLIDTIGDDEG